ncbi:MULTISPECIES: IS1380 family transposase [unclassified Nocardioides]|uniref:IS1380 family transposase n=1 Tax=unclassified Nocardioides TaxID=2615069 RepID=UPI0009EFD9C5|nr:MULTISPECIES: IS1380 family transposase [unclassified Nocardioides]GAW49591.1 transposase, IS4 family protein [Nocardioides sp. PD653-B2]GAW57569.1 transposase, IS4 family protein [Nocardioides sp. PD653]
MQRNKRIRRVVVSADGQGVLSHAGVGLLREMVEYSGLVGEVTSALIDTYKGLPVHAPGRVFTDLAVAVADGADAISGIAVLADRQDLFGPVASMPTTWRVLDRVDDAHLDAVRDARSKAREAAWAAGAGPDLAGELRLDFDATITIAHSEKENAAATWKKTFGFHPLLCFLDRPDVAGGEALAGLLRKGNASSNTAADHIRVLDMALAALPEHARPRPGEEPGGWEGPRLLARSDSAGATHAFAEACVERGVGFSFGFPVDMRIQRVVDAIPEECWHPALQTDHGDGNDLREGAWVAEATGMIDLTGWPEGSRLILRRERPHPGAQLTFTDVDGHRITAILTNTGPGIVPGQAAGLELRHRQHARVEDRSREAKATGLRNFPCRAFNENRAWLEVVLTAVDLVCWTKQICFADVPELARCEIAAFRYRVLHVAARLTHAARRVHLRIDKTWRWAAHIAEGFHRLRAAFT